MALLFRSSVDAEARWKPQLKGLGFEVALWGPISKNREGAAGLQTAAMEGLFEHELFCASRDGDRPIVGSTPTEDLDG